MACQKPEHSLSDADLQLYLEALTDHALNSVDLSKKIGRPLFNVRGRLRELHETDYIEKSATDEYTTAPKGKTWLAQRQAANVNANAE